MTHKVRLTAVGQDLTLTFGSEQDHIARAIEQTGTFYESELLGDVRSRLFFARCAIDVGAHVGNHALYFAHVLGLRTIAYEPNPVTFTHLARNIRDNKLDDRCCAKNLAVGAASARVRASHAPEINTGMAIVEADASGPIGMVRLDDEVLGEPQIDVIKVDVEGWELNVLEGATGVLQRYRPLLYIEATETHFGEVAALLRSQDYVCWKRFNHTPTFLFLPCERLGVARMETKV